MLKLLMFNREGIVGPQEVVLEIKSAKEKGMQNLVKAL